MAPGTALQAWLDGPLRRRLDAQTRRRAPRLPAPQVFVRAPGVRFSYGDAERPFHCASIGKLFTAVVIGRLIERGLLTLNTPVGTVVPAAELARLPAVPGVDLAHELTVDHLLSHHSGLPDPFLPPRGQHTACAMTMLPDDLDRRWTLRDFLGEAAGLAPVGRPGERFHYSDAGYALLLRVAEEVGDAPAGELLASHVFDPSGMPGTHQPHLNASRAELADLDIAPMWLGRTEVSRTPAVSVGSVDGGAVTTIDDLVRFQQALHDGRLIDPGLLSQLSRRRARLRPGIHYCAGLATLRFGEFTPLLLRGLPEPTGGLGLTATHLFRYPAQDAHVVMNFHATDAMRPSFQIHIEIARRLARLN
ncbi:MAG: serine hydrolase domain-containing protein [Propionibacteriaceae bacterium]|nr:serine hydrolase domain-containing protein [Propionibacteriaceae bacterium]